jgi:hypothetical protein
MLLHHLFAFNTILHTVWLLSSCSQDDNSVSKRCITKEERERPRTKAERGIQIIITHFEGFVRSFIYCTSTLSYWPGQLDHVTMLSFKKV